VEPDLEFGELLLQLAELAALAGGERLRPVGGEQLVLPLLQAGHQRVLGCLDRLVDLLGVLADGGVMLADERVGHGHAAALRLVRRRAEGEDVEHVGVLPALGPDGGPQGGDGVGGGLGRGGQHGGRVAGHDEAGDLVDVVLSGSPLVTVASPACRRSSLALDLDASGTRVRVCSGWPTSSSGPRPSRRWQDEPLAAQDHADVVAEHQFFAVGRGAAGSPA
jgi:hypothetical protein